MENKILQVEQLVELAMATEVNGELPWDDINIGKESAYSMMAAHVIDMLEKEQEADKEIVMMTVMTKLLVENFLLNLKLQQSNG